jgi:hypothetical protein
MKLNRRQLMKAAAWAPALAARAQQPATEADPAKAARDTNQRNSETLAKFEVPMSTEPAFQFKA